MQSITRYIPTTAELAHADRCRGIWELILNNEPLTARDIGFLCNMLEGEFEQVDQDRILHHSSHDVRAV